MDDLILSLRVLLLLAAANMSPIGATRVLGDRWSAPLDGGLRFFDGQPLLGASKTVRGACVAMASATAAAVVLRFPWEVGFEVGAIAMVGDAAASFVKRRLRLPPSAKSTGLDQIPEALLPLLAVRAALDLSWLQVAGVTLAFFALEIPLARLSFRLGLRERPF